MCQMSVESKVDMIRLVTLSIVVLLTIEMNDIYLWVSKVCLFVCKNLKDPLSNFIAAKIFELRCWVLLKADFYFIYKLVLTQIIVPPPRIPAGRTPEEALQGAPG